ncbi:MAG: aldo/keto reductase [Acidimicrobiales bacterium]
MLRLRLDQIPLYQSHRPDPAVPLEESIGAIVALKDEGKIRHIGVGNVDEDQLKRAQRLTPIVSVRNRYNPADRRSDAVVDLCEWERSRSCRGPRSRTSMSARSSPRSPPVTERRRSRWPWPGCWPDPRPSWHSGHRVGPPPGGERRRRRPPTRPRRARHDRSMRPRATG